MKLPFDSCRFLSHVWHTCSLVCFSAVAFGSDYTFIDKDRPVHFEAEYRTVGRAKFSNHKFKHSHVNYADGFASVYYTRFLNPTNTLTGQVGYSYMKFDWDENPRFRQDNFNFATASLAWVASGFGKWRLISDLGFSVNAQNFDFGKTAVYYGLIWGRYHYSNTLGLHLGAFGYTGVENQFALPILGIDYRFRERWVLTAIFPLDLSLTYAITEHWSASVAYATFGGPYGYPIRARHGIGPFKDPIFELFSQGAELDFEYRYKHIFFGLGGGWNFGGWIDIRNSHNHHGKQYDFNSAPYAQAYFSYRV